MRIAIYHNLPSGGGKRALHEMTRRLAPRHDLAVYTLSTADHDFCDLRPYCRAHVVIPFRPTPLVKRPFGRINQAIRAIDLIRLKSTQIAVADIIDNGDYDVVFAHVCRFGQSPALLQYLNTPSAYYCAEPPRLLYEPPEERPYGQYSTIQRVGNVFDPLPALYRRTLAHIDRKNIRAATLLLANSHYSRETIYRIYGVFSSVSRLGVDTTTFRPYSIIKDKFVLSVGSLTAKKGFEFLIVSLAKIESSYRPALVIVSNHSVPAEKAYLESLANEHSVVLSIHVGVSDSTLIDFYNRALLTVYTPVMEPFGFVPIESMACGTPVVGIREAGVRETVRHGETGLLTERDAAQFANAVITLLQDDSKRAQMAENARQYAENEWSWDQSIEDLELQLQRVARR